MRFVASIWTIMERAACSFVVAGVLVVAGMLVDRFVAALSLGGA